MTPEPAHTQASVDYSECPRCGAFIEREQVVPLGLDSFCEECIGADDDD